MTERPILLDEGADRRLGAWLGTEGCDVTIIGVDHPASLEDREVLAIAFREDRLLITRDNDFGRLVVQDALPHAGVILLRFRRYLLDLQQARLRHVFSDFSRQLDRFLVVTETDVRVR